MNFTMIGVDTKNNLIECCLVDVRAVHYKIDATLQHSIFHVDGFRLCRCDIKAGCLLVYIESDIFLIRVK